MDLFIDFETPSSMDGRVADRLGNVMIWGLVGVQKEAVLASKRSIVTLEEIVDGFETQSNAVVLPHWVVTAVCEVPGGAHPSYALGYTRRDNAFYQEWDSITRERESFEAWMRRPAGNSAWRARSNKRRHRRRRSSLRYVISTRARSVLIRSTPRRWLSFSAGRPEHRASIGRAFT